MSQLQNKDPLNGNKEVNKDPLNGNKDEKNLSQEESPEILISEDLDNSSQIYMVCLDCEPVFYCVEREEAREEAIRLAKKMTINYIGENVTVEELDEDTVVLVRRNKWFVISYDSIVNSVSVVKLPRFRKSNKKTN